MPRKNSRVGRAKDRGRMSRFSNPLPPPHQPKHRVRVPVEHLVLPDGTCRKPGAKKARFDSREKAGRALAQAQRMRQGSSTGHVEKRYYQCPVEGCGYHLTSRESYEERRS